MEIAVRVESARIYIKAPFLLKDNLKGLPGSRWDPAAKNWTLPATPTAAMELVRMANNRSVTLFPDESFEGLVTQALELKEIQKLRDHDSLPDVPVTRFPAWNHQRQAFWFAEPQPAVMLNMDMATGKTKVVIDLILNRGHKRVLVVGPTHVIADTWPREIAKHTPEGREIRFAQLARGVTRNGNPKQIPVSSKKKMAEALLRYAGPCGDPALVLINYESVWRDPFAKWALSQRWDLVVLDEIHKVKSPGGKASRFVAKLGEKVPYRLGLTGTVMPHSPMDVYGQFRFLDPSIFGTSFTGFRSRYAVMGGFGGYEIKGYQDQEDFRRRLMSITYQVGAEVLDLPPVQHIERNFYLEPAARMHYQEMEDNFWTQVEAGEVTASNALTRLLRLQQITSGFIMDDDGELREVSSAKEDLLYEVLDSLEPGEPVVIFTRFKQDIVVIRRVCERLAREVPKEDRDLRMKNEGRGFWSVAELSGARSDLAAWTNGHYDILAAQIQSGGVGIDLTRSRYCIYFSLGFSLGDYEQSLARVNRPTQKRPVVYIHLVAVNTVDEKVYSALRKKKAVIESILSAGQ